MKKLFVVLAILFVGILLAGCTSKPAEPVATPAPTTVPTPAPTVPPTPVPTTIAVEVKNETAAPTTPSPSPTPQPSVTITFTRDLTILPGPTVYIPVGGKVIWKNEDPFKPHGVQTTNVALAGYLPGGLGENQIPYSGTLEVTFDKPGAYDYTTIFQPETIGKIIVTK